MEIYNNDCLEKLKDLSDNSVDLLFCDLPYGQTSCKWDCNIDLDLFWKQINRVCKLTTPMFFTCSTKFGVSLISSNPKNFRYDLVWVKSASCGFLNAKKMPLKKHEMIYVFYRKLPFYDLSLHQHKFLPERKTIDYKNDSFIYGTIDRPDYMRKNGESSYDPPLPKSVIRTDEGCNSLYGEENKKVFIYDEKGKLRNSETRYEPPLPNSIINCKYDVNKNAYGGGKEGRIKISKNKEDHETKYEPPLPNSVIGSQISREKKSGINNLYGDMKGGTIGNIHGSNYEPQLPNTILEMKSEKGQHATQKPVALIEWCLKYYSKEGDVVLDPTMGSGSTGLACQNLNRKFIGIEKDTEIFNLAKKRLSL